MYHEHLPLVANHQALAHKVVGQRQWVAMHYTDPSETDLSIGFDLGHLESQLEKDHSDLGPSLIWFCL